MKTVILFLLISVGLFAQGKYDPNNSPTANLGANKLYTGTRSECWNYHSIVVHVYASHASATKGVAIEFSMNGTNYDREVYWNYTALDTTTEFVTPVLGYYYRLKYLNGADSATTFRVKTYLSKDWVPLVKYNGELMVNVSSSTQMDSLEATLDRLNALVQVLRTATDGLEVKLDSIDNQQSRVHSELIKKMNKLSNGSTEIISQLLDDDPTLIVSSGVLIGNKKKVSFMLSYNETEVGNTVSGAITFEVSPDNINWYDYDIVYDHTGSIVSTINYTGDGEDVFYIPEWVTFPYMRATFTGTNTDANDTIQINVTLCYQE